MKSLRSLVLAFLLLSILIPSQAFTSGINAVVSSLADYQTDSGGFRATKDAEPSLEATAQALFLSSLFGLRDKINSGEVSTYIQSLNNPDHGYSNQPGQPSDLESVRFALLSFSHLGNRIVNPAGLGAFIQSLYDRETKLYANTFGGTGDIKSTAIAFQCFEMLSLLQSAEVIEKAEAIKKNFAALIKVDGATRYFSSITGDNYYAIVIASYVGIDFTPVESWAKYFVDRQVKEGPFLGGFFADQSQKEVNFEDLGHALSALYVLQQALPSSPALPDTVNTTTLARYANNLPRSLLAAASAYTALARTSSFQSTFKITTHYDVLDSRYRLVGDRIIQGTQLKPVLHVRTHYGLAHAGLDVSVIITLKSSSEKSTRKLTWNSESQSYVTDELYNTSDKLGDLTFDYVIRWLVVDLGNDLTMEISDKKTIGYDLSVRAKALHAGKEIEPNGIIGIGTEFAFDLRLGTQKQPKPSLLSGDFDIKFTVLDSSDVTIHEHVFNARGNTVPINFKYTLDDTKVPGGDLTFNFAIGNSEGVHTHDFVSYALPLTMVATQISFEKFDTDTVATYQIGDTVVVRMQPGSLPDLRTVHYYNAKDFYSTPVIRLFFMDVSSSETQATLFSLPGTPETNNEKTTYVFRLPVDPTFDAIGTNVVSFRYVTAKGKSVQLQNYDSKLNELFEDGKYLTYSVNTELHVINVKNGPKDGVLDYGNEVKFNFQVIDANTKKLVFAGSEKGTAYLVLRHKEDNRSPFTSNKQPAHQVYDKDGKPKDFAILWAVNPNAVKGKGYLELVAQGADGKEIPIFEEKTKSQWRVNVVIGGTISFSNREYSTQLDEEDSVFLVEFDLSCKEKQLHDARLKAVVRHVPSGGKPPEIVVALPVTQSRQGGRYEVSWLQPSQQVKSGEYVVDFYREVDRRRALETGTPEADVESKLQPLFTISFTHQGGSGSRIPIKMELVALLLVGGAFFWLVFQKMELEGTRKNKKKKTK